MLKIVVTLRPDNITSAFTGVCAQCLSGKSNQILERMLPKSEDMVSACHVPFSPDWDVFSWQRL